MADKVRVAEDGYTVEAFVAEAHAYHPANPPIDLKNVSWQYWHITSPEGYWSVSGVAVGLLGNGQWVVVDGDADTTGWDCRSGAVWTVHATLNDVVRYGLTNWTRELLNFGV